MKTSKSELISHLVQKNFPLHENLQTSFISVNVLHNSNQSARLHEQVSFSCDSLTTRHKEVIGIEKLETNKRKNAFN